MKFYNIPLALALLFAPVQTHAKQNTGASDYKQEATNGAPSGKDRQGKVKRYIVKYKKGSSDYNARLQNAQNDAKRVQGNGNDGRGSEQGNQGKMRNSPVSSLPVKERGDDMLKYGKFLPRANAEVIYLDKANKKKYKKRDDVEYVELGEGNTLHYMLGCLEMSVQVLLYSTYCLIIMSHFILRPPIRVS